MSWTQPIPDADRRRLPRHRADEQEPTRRRRIQEITEHAATVTPVGGATVGGDALRMRGVPFVAKSVAGVMPHTDPLRALLAKECRHRDVRSVGG